VKGWKQIVGVVGDTRIGGMTSELGPQVYWPYGAISTQDPGYVIRAAGNPTGLVTEVRRAIAAINPETIVVQAMPMREMLSATIADRSFVELLLAVFAALALLLASIGIYGVVAFWVTQRTQEIGVRVALGASARSVFRLVLAQTAAPVVAGIAVGLTAAFLLTPLLATQIFGVTPRDPIAFTAAAFVLGAVAMAAALFPARRALRIDPAVALRQE
jgi:putative ABC transport system permease protein